MKKPTRNNLNFLIVVNKKSSKPDEPYFGSVKGLVQNIKMTTGFN